MTIVDSSRLIATANQDREFQLHARLWNARLALRCSDEPAAMLRLTVSHGRMIVSESSDLPADVQISAPRADWDALLAALPQPFYQDLRAACAHHGFRLDGERLHTAAFYPAIRRLIELLREVRNA